MDSQRLGSRYVLEAQIGQGGLGVVWRGRDLETGATYAIKLLKPEAASDPAIVSRFVRERTALLRFRHPNVVTLHDMIVEGDRLALVMEYIGGGDLADYRARRGGTLPPGEAATLMAQTCDALAAAHHAGIVHRDLKPANILLDRSGVRLTDFGISSVVGEPSVTTTGSFFGTLSYLAPEIIQGEEPAPACDVYAVGITLHELIVGRVPFTGQVPAAIMFGHLNVTPERADAIPPGLWPIIAACLEKDPAHRPTTTDVAAALRGAPLPALPTFPAFAGAGVGRSAASGGPSRPYDQAQTTPRAPFAHEEHTGSRYREDTANRHGASSARGDEGSAGQLPLGQRLLQRRRFWAVVLLAALVIGIAAGTVFA